VIGHENRVGPDGRHDHGAQRECATTGLDYLPGVVLDAELFRQARMDFNPGLRVLIDEWADSATQNSFATDAARTDPIRTERAEAASRYFAGHAEVWDQIRSLHVAESEVERAIDGALSQRPLGRLVDIGTGTGRMIELFGPRAAQAIGIDRSSEMLRLARVKLESAGIQSSLRQGDMYALPLADHSAESVIIHQVLHYAHSPAAAIAEAARVLTPGGTLLVVDFAAHEREDPATRDAGVQRRRGVGVHARERGNLSDDGLDAGGRQRGLAAREVSRDRGTGHAQPAPRLVEDPGRGDAIASGLRPELVARGHEQHASPGTSHGPDVLPDGILTRPATTEGNTPVTVCVRAEWPSRKRVSRVPGLSS